MANQLTPEQIVLKSLKVLLNKSLHGTIGYEDDVRELIRQIDNLLPKKDEYYGDW